MKSERNVRLRNVAENSTSHSPQEETLFCSLGGDRSCSILKLDKTYRGTSALQHFQIRFQQKWQPRSSVPVLRDHRDSCRHVGDYRYTFLKIAMTRYQRLGSILDMLDEILGLLVLEIVPSKEWRCKTPKSDKEHPVL